MLGLRPKAFCHICNKSLYFKAYTQDDFIFCHKHLKLYQGNEWVKIKSFNFHAEDEDAAKLEDLRIALYFKNNLPTLQIISYLELDSKLITKTELLGLEKDKSDIQSQLLENSL